MRIDSKKNRFTCGAGCCQVNGVEHARKRNGAALTSGREFRRHPLQLSNWPLTTGPAPIAGSTVSRKRYMVVARSIVKNCQPLVRS